MWRDIEEAARRLMDLFPLKAAAGVCLLSLEQHALMFLAFSLLVAMDCLSRWLAISAGMLKEKSGGDSSLAALASLDSGGAA